MPKWGYSIQDELLDPETTVKTSGREIHVSHKHAREVCKAIKGMMLPAAKTYMQDVMEKKKAIPFRRYRKKAGHRAGLVKAFAGRYPIKTAKAMLKLLQAAEANAENKNLNTDQMKITHAAASQGMKVKRFTPRAHGRASPHFDTLTHIELALTQIGQGETA
jgi:large subunit ribosomal protein L22